MKMYGINLKKLIGYSRWMIVFALLVVVFAQTSYCGSPASAQEKALPFEVVKIQSGSLTLQGALWMPQGPGPFPAVVYNHGSEESSALCAIPDKGYGNVGAFYAGQGFVCLIPFRRGHSGTLDFKTVCQSQGVWFNTRVKKICEQRGITTQPGINEVWLQQQDVDNEDVAAAVQWLSSQSYVESNKMFMSGISFGGIQTLLASEKGLGVKSFVPFAPGAESWCAVPQLHDRLKCAVLAAKAPIFMLQAENDYSLGPTQFLGPIIDSKGLPNTHKLYPPFDPEKGHKAGHGGFATWQGGIKIWSPDVLKFLIQTGGLTCNQGWIK